MADPAPTSVTPAAPIHRTLGKIHTLRVVVVHRIARALSLTLESIGRQEPPIGTQIESLIHVRRSVVVVLVQPSYIQPASLLPSRSRA